MSGDGELMSDDGELASKADHHRDDKPEQSLHEQINAETAVVNWKELVRHFARGVVIKVSKEIDLIEAAACLAEDNATQLQSWLEHEQVMRASDDDARDWTAREPDFWCVVTAPWVLVQEKH